MKKKKKKGDDLIASILQEEHNRRMKHLNKLLKRKRYEEAREWIVKSRRRWPNFGKGIFKYIEKEEK